VDKAARTAKRSQTVRVSSTAPRQVRYPKLRPQLPVLQRSGGEIQIGVDSESAVVFTEPRLAPVLRALDGAHHLHAIREAGIAEGLPAAQVDEMLQVLAEWHMLLEGGRGLRPPDALSGQSVLLIGAGQLGQNIATLLTQSQVGQLRLVDNEPTEQNLHRPPDLTIIASETVEADRLIAADLLRADRPHLVVRAAGETAVVGPLVVPGRTACLACTDLTRRDTDPAWPTLLDQLTRLRLPASDLLNAWAVCSTATQALAFLRNGTPEACGATIELNEHDFRTRWRVWTAHPGCGCHWFGAREWGHG
jgi:hypothetical protein